MTRAAAMRWQSDGVISRLPAAEPSRSRRDCVCIVIVMDTRSIHYDTNQLSDPQPYWRPEQCHRGLSPAGMRIENAGLGDDTLEIPNWHWRCIDRRLGEGERQNL
jgi:hypothetical protein